MNKRCDNCIYGCDGNCGSVSVCSDYFPVDPDIEYKMEDDAVERAIEDGRDAFRRQWFEYISEYE